jgi:hypothetical protein
VRVFNATCRIGSNIVSHAFQKRVQKTPKRGIDLTRRRVRKIPAERSHRGLDNSIIEPSDELRCTTGKVTCRARLGGILRFY